MRKFSNYKHFYAAASAVSAVLLLLLLRSLKEKGSMRTETFHKRYLPDQTSIAFSSVEGRLRFSRSLHSGFAEPYFALAEQFRTQDEPAFCGLATLVMCLNAMAIDPGRVWKGVWRWFSEDMLSGCKSLELIKKEGRCDEILQEKQCFLLMKEEEGKEEKKNVAENSHVYVCSHLFILNRN